MYRKYFLSVFSGHSGGKRANTVLGLKEFANEVEIEKIRWFEFSSWHHPDNLAAILTFPSLALLLSTSNLRTLLNTWSKPG
jgi:hypothetical protein